jgi:hypothetical protein
MTGLLFPNLNVAIGDSTCCHGYGCICCSSGASLSAQGTITSTAGGKEGSPAAADDKNDDKEIIADHGNLRVKTCCERFFSCCRGKSQNRHTRDVMYTTILNVPREPEELHVIALWKNIDLIEQYNSGSSPTIGDAKAIEKAFEDAKAYYHALEIVLDSIKLVKAEPEATHKPSPLSIDTATEGRLIRRSSPSLAARRFNPMPVGFDPSQRDSFSIPIESRVRADSADRALAEQKAIEPSQFVSINISDRTVPLQIGEVFLHAAQKQVQLSKAEAETIRKKLLLLRVESSGDPKRLEVLAKEDPVNLLTAAEVRKLILLAMKVHEQMVKTQGGAVHPTTPHLSGMARGGITLPKNLGQLATSKDVLPKSIDLFTALVSS